MNIDVSVVCPTFRRPGQLAEALKSVLDQRGVTFDVAVIDDSPERSAEQTVAGLVDPRIRYSAFTPPTGGRPAKVRNSAWRGTTGRYLHFLDDDDRVVPGAYRLLADALDAHPEVGVAFGIVVPFGDDAAKVAEERAFFERAHKRARRCHGLRHAFLAELLFNDTLLVNSACMIRRSCVCELGGYEETMSTFEDVEFYARAIGTYGAVFVDAPVLERRVGPSLVHDLPDGTAIAAAYRQMHAKFRAKMGTARFLATKTLSRTVLRWI
jgi:glycosyltransferase involved in cell wall biosynthesis